LTLESLGLDPNEIKKTLSLQKQKKEREFIFIVFLTPLEAEKLANQTGKEFIRASEWKDRRKR